MMVKPSPLLEIPILLTSSVVAHDDGVSLKNTDERTRLALESVARWLKIAPNSPLVLCDGSSFDFSPLIAEKFPAAKVECLNFENDQALVRLYGRGYGEGEIVRYALEHSHEIALSGRFAKCSSKLWVENFIHCLSFWNGKMLVKAVFDNVFSIRKKTQLSYIDTRFYVMSSAIYRQHFELAHHHINTVRGYGLEECFTSALLQAELLGCVLPEPPVICGVGGGMGKYYKNTWKRRIKERLRYQIANRHPAFSMLFATRPPRTP